MPTQHDNDKIPSKRLGGFSFVFVVCEVSVLTITAAIVCLRSRFEAVIIEMWDGPLPFLTKLIFNTPLWISMSFFGILSIAMVFKEFVIKEKTKKRKVNIIALLLNFLILFLCCWALFGLMIHIITNLKVE